MNNYQQPGCTIPLTAPYACDAGEGCLVDQAFGVAVDDVASGAEGQFQTEGVFDLAKTSAQAWTQGQRIHWDDTNQRCDSDPALGRCIGYATEAAANPSSTGAVRLNGVGAPRVQAVLQGSPAPTSKATAGAVTLTAAEVLTGVLVVDCAGGSRTYTLPTAALLVPAVKGAKVGDMLKLLVVNGSDAAEVVTITEGAGGGFDTNQTAASRVVGQNTSKVVHIRLTNVTASSEAYVVYA